MSSEVRLTASRCSRPRLVAPSPLDRDPPLAFARSSTARSPGGRAPRGPRATIVRPPLPPPARPAPRAHPPSFPPLARRRRSPRPPPRPRGAGAQGGDHRAHPEVPGREPAAHPGHPGEPERRQARLRRGTRPGCSRTMYCRHRGRSSPREAGERRREPRGCKGGEERDDQKRKEAFGGVADEKKRIRSLTVHRFIRVHPHTRSPAPRRPPFFLSPSPTAYSPRFPCGEHRSALVQVGVPDEGAELPDVVLVLELPASPARRRWSSATARVSPRRSSPAEFQPDDVLAEVRLDDERLPAASRARGSVARGARCRCPATLTERAVLHTSPATRGRCRDRQRRTDPCRS